VRRAATVAALLLLAPVAACANDAASGGTGSSAPDATLTVYAASSLTSTFTEIGERFEASHPGVRVRLDFGGSSDLVAQIQQGAPADVFASADAATMDKAVAAGAVADEPVDFASNTLEIVVPADNPARVASLEDLGRRGTAVVLCAPVVPCGAAARSVEESSGVAISPVSEEQAVSDVLTKVESGEADAGLVYVTDVQAAGDEVVGITFPGSSAAVNTYPIASLAGSGNAALARAFVDLVTGPEGQAVLADAGFAKP
jgi:molybdate transport system substrate-binding protein